MPWPPRFARMAAHFGGGGPSMIANPVRWTRAERGPARRLAKPHRLLGSHEKRIT